MIDFLNSLTALHLTLFLILGISLFIQICYYLFVFSRLAFYKAKKDHHEQKPVSIVIAARNESENLKQNLRSVLEQSYPDFEVIVVNDCSWDDSQDFLDELENKYKNLKVVTLQEQARYSHGKKFALTMGIKAATHELLLLTDADCMPASKHWLENMQQHFNERTNIILGYGAYQKKDGLLNKIIRYDTFYSAMQYLSFSLAGLTYMGVGRNLAYRKSLFFQNKGFAKHQHILSGDDDLFINEVATSSNTAIEIKSDSFTLSVPKNTFTEWLKQKKRHISTSHLYKTKYKILLALLSFSQFTFYASLIALLAIQLDWRIISALYGFRLLVQYIIAGKSMKRLRETDLLWILPLLDFFLILFYIILALSNTFVKQRKWK